MAQRYSVHRAGLALPAPFGEERTCVLADNPLLLRLRLLTNLAEADLLAIDGLCGDRRYLRARMTVAQQGRPAERVLVVLDGWACGYRLLADGRRQITQLMVAGDLCNLEALHLPQTGARSER